MIRTQFVHSHDNEYNRFKREGVMMEHSSGPIDQLSQSLFSTQGSDLNTPSLTIPFVSLIHPILSLVVKDSLLFVSIQTNLCPTSTLPCYHLYDCEILPYCFIIHSSILWYTGYTLIYSTILLFINIHSRMYSNYNSLQSAQSFGLYYSPCPSRSHTSLLYY